MGRGKPGSRWYSPQGGLYFSVILKPRKNPNDLSPVTVLAAECVVKALNDLGISSAIEPPNDVLVGGKKICGVLTEKTGDSLIIGIGLNVNFDEFPEGINATSLTLVTGKAQDPDRIFNAVVAELKARYLKFLGDKV